MKATLDFENKTISLDGEVTLGELLALQEALTDWQEWRVLKDTSIVTIPQPYPGTTWPTPQYPYPAHHPWGTWTGGTYI